MDTQNALQWLLERNTTIPGPRHYFDFCLNFYTLKCSLCPALMKSEFNVIWISVPFCHSDGTVLCKRQLLEN